MVKYIQRTRPNFLSISKAIKKNFRFKKVGHLGTLDPLATGVLPIAVGEATKAINFISMLERGILL